MLFGEPDGPAVAARLRECRLVAPSLLYFEVASICTKKLNKHPDQHDALLEGLRYLRRLPIERFDVDLSGVVMLAEKSGLTAYDASYLWLARQLNAELVTLDHDLKSAAES